MPRFDKLTDDRTPSATWPLVVRRPDVIFFEGWCVGARAEDRQERGEPINALEAEQDPHGVWWGWSQAALAGDYQRLFGMCDLQIFIRVPDMALVIDSRWRQEQALANQGTPPGATPMNREEVARFVMAYERLTQEMLSDLPGRADLLPDRLPGFAFSVAPRA